MCSRPRRFPRISPALESTSRCFLTAWRDTGLFALRREIDSGPLDESRTSSLSRVTSPSAAKRGAASRTCATSMASARDMAPDVLRLDAPSLGVHPERLVATPRREAIEAGLDHREQRALR